MFIQFRPPTYDMSRARTKTVLFWSEQDAFASGLDVDALKKTLPRYVDYRLNGFSHIDFLYGLSARALIYDRIVAYIRANRDHNGTFPRFV